MKSEITEVYTELGMPEYTDIPGDITEHVWSIDSPKNTIASLKSIGFDDYLGSTMRIGLADGEVASLVKNGVFALVNEDSVTVLDVDEEEL